MAHDPQPDLNSLLRRRLVALALAAGICILIVYPGGLNPSWGFAAFVVIAAAVMLASMNMQTPSPYARNATGLLERVERDSIIAGLLNAYPESVLLLDARSNIRFTNPAAADLIPGAETGQPLTLYLRAPEIADALDRMMAGGGPETIPFVQPYPAERRLEAVISPLGQRGPNGRPDMMFVAFRDLTPVQRLERMRADFVANASHELRTPLASLTGFIETLQGPARDDREAQDKFLAIMNQQAARMARLIDDLMSLSRIELKANIMPGSVVELNNVILHVVDSLQPIAKDAGVTINLDADTESVMVAGEADELTQLFQNIIENAIKYGRDGKNVDVSLAVAGDKVSVAIRDHGPGIPAQHLPRLTERFYRVDVAQSRESGGTGLGLAIVKHILNRHHGTMRVESEEGQGATFTISLPLKAD